MAFTPTEEAQLRAVITAFESGKTISEILASTEVFTTDVLEVVQSAVSKKATIAQIITLVNSELGITAISSKLSGVEAGAQVNIIESVKVNNTVLPVSSKSVNITVPTQPSDIGAQASLGFTPEQAGVAASLITALKNGVPTEGDTLKKLYDLIVASFSEVQVATIAARDEYNITKLPTNVFVLDDGDSKWALYKATTTGVNATYVKLSDPDLLNAVMTASQIAISYESVDDVNRFTDALKAKLDAFTANFTVELKAAYDGKQNSLTIGNLTSTTSGVTIGNGTGAVIGSGATVNIATAGVASDGILTSGHFNTFNSKEPAITKNTAFNKNFGTTPGTVLEGRTFGTAANSAVGDFQPIENQRLSTTNSPSFSSITSTVATGIAPLTVNSTTMVGNLNAQYLGGTSLSELVKYVRNGVDANSMGTNTIGYTYSNNAPYYGSIIDLGHSGYSMQFNSSNGSSGLAYRSNNDYTWGNWQTIYTSGNLTNTLSTNYIPKWNGSSLVNGLISDDGAFVNIGGILSGGYGTVLQAGANINSSIASTISNQSSGSSASANLYLNAFGNSWVMRVGSFANNNNAFSILTDRASPVERFKIETNGVVTISSTTTSTATTTGALVVGGGVGAAHVRANNFYGNGSNLTGVQLPITLTTNGTSGAATFSGNVLNVPNYGSGAVGGTYTCTTSNLDGLSYANIYSAAYTRIGSVTNIGIRGVVETTRTGWCKVTLSLPSGTGSDQICNISAYTLSGPTPITATLDATGYGYCTISFTSPASATAVQYHLTMMAY